MIAQEKLKKILKYNPIDGEFYWKISPTPRIKPGDRAGRKSITIEGETYDKNELIWLYNYGFIPEEDELVDTPKKLKKSGIYFSKKVNKWIARVTINKEHKYLGGFNSIKDAVLARHNYLKGLKNE